MIIVLWLLFSQGLLGAFDTLYFHEWRARLPARFPGSRSELLLHGGRSLIYAVLFFTLPRFAWQGNWLILLLFLFTTEILFTLWDFVVEDRVRIPLGGVFPGERVMHAIMGILYGAMLALFFPIGWLWWNSSTGLNPLQGIPVTLQLMMTLMAIGVFVSGLRDLSAGLGFTIAAWPWRVEKSNVEPKKPLRIPDTDR